MGEQAGRLGDREVLGAKLLEADLVEVDRLSRRAAAVAAGGCGGDGWGSGWGRDWRVASRVGGRRDGAGAWARGGGEAAGAGAAARLGAACGTGGGLRPAARGWGLRRGGGAPLHRTEHGLLGLRGPALGLASALLGLGDAFLDLAQPLLTLGLLAISVCARRSASAARRSAALVRSSICRRRSCASASERSCASRSCCRRCSAVCRSGGRARRLLRRQAGGGTAAMLWVVCPAWACALPRLGLALQPLGLLRCGDPPRPGSAPPRAGFRRPCPARAVRRSPGHSRHARGRAAVPPRLWRYLRGAGTAGGGTGAAGGGTAAAGFGGMGGAGTACGGWANWGWGCAGTAGGCCGGTCAAEPSARSAARTVPAPARRASLPAPALPWPLPSSPGARLPASGDPRFVSWLALRGDASPLPGCACGVRRGRRAAVRAPACASPWRSTASPGVTGAVPL